MAKIFLSYSSLDAELAQDIQSRLEKKGHNILIPAGMLPAGKWQELLSEALQKADIFVALLSDHGLQSSWVCSEVGAARVHDDQHGLLLLPVLVGERPIPHFISDYACFRLVNDDPSEKSRLVDQIDEAITQYKRNGSRSPRIFVSHRHKDEAQAKALIELIEAYFAIDKYDIRCTSVHPYKLEAGNQTSESLRKEIKRAEVVIGLLSKGTSESNYVLAELGAAWGIGVPTFPLRIRGAQFENVPEPLNERNSLSLTDERECFQLVEDIARITSLVPREHVLGRVQEKVANLVKLCREEI